VDVNKLCSNEYAAPLPGLIGCSYGLPCNSYGLPCHVAGSIGVCACAL
jgi:hypothetical protein